MVDINILNSLEKCALEVINKSHYLSINDLRRIYETEDSVCVVFSFIASSSYDAELLKPHLEEFRFYIKGSFFWEWTGEGNMYPKISFLVDYKKYSRVYKIKNL